VNGAHETPGQRRSDISQPLHPQFVVDVGIDSGAQLEDRRIEQHAENCHHCHRDEVADNRPQRGPLGVEIFASEQREHRMTIRGRSEHQTGLPHSVPWQSDHGQYAMDKECRGHQSQRHRQRIPQPRSEQP